MKFEETDTYTNIPIYLTIPAVTVFWRVKGQPNATTQSPGRSLLEVPNFAVGNGVFELIFTIAMSECRSAFTTVPSYVRPSCKLTSIYSSSYFITMLSFVT